MGGSWGELGGVGELCKGNFVRSYVGQWVGLHGGAVWVGGGAVRRSCVWGHAHQSPDGLAIHNCLQYSQHKRDSHYPLTHPAPPTLPTAAAR